MHTGWTAPQNCRTPKIEPATTLELSFMPLIHKMFSSRLIFNQSDKIWAFFAVREPAPRSSTVLSTELVSNPHGLSRQTVSALYWCEPEREAAMFHAFASNTASSEEGL
jgi:hypothetical protein